MASNHVQLGVSGEVAKQVNDKPMVSSDTLKAYLETDYWVEPGDGAPRFALRVGERCEPLAVLVGAGPRCGGFLTAYNPLGVPTTEAANHAANTDLAARMAPYTTRILAGEGRGRDGAWPAEPSWFATGIDFDLACQLGRQFRQNAFVWVGADLTPILVVLRGV